MPKVRLELKQETFDKLLTVAVADRRPVDWQAEVLLERALGIRSAEGSMSDITDDADTPLAESRAEGAANVFA